MEFQKKYWFYDDITIDYFDLLLNIIYHGKRVGLSLYMFPSHHGGKFAAYIKKIEE